MLSPSAVREQRQAAFGEGLEHRTEKWNPLFGKIRCQNKGLDRHFASDRTRGDLKPAASIGKPVLIQGAGEAAPSAGAVGSGEMKWMPIWRFLTQTRAAGRKSSS